MCEVIAEVHRAGLPCLVVDDGSTDRTAYVASQTRAAVLSLPINLGVGGALRTAFRYAVQHGYDAVVQVDADGQHVASEIEQLVACAEAQGSDMVVGSRFSGQRSDYRISVVRRSCIRLLANRVKATGLTVSDPTSGFRLIRKPLLEAYARSFPSHYLGDTFEALLVAGRRGYRVSEAPVSMRSRQGGQPSADMSALVRAMIRSVAVTLTGPSFDIPVHEQEK